ncbi:hypothetical protein BCR39DRAFT_561654 [Naematelia encephala]|uniref:Uncharacterized protein n=1 Tax=Naematelia encephala TaxID=71784 RepID=A0A1Y2AP81_9TREE|nr:hypothetical protein BCR39DRAFT_561654 [Naematelia encephala]
MNVTLDKNGCFTFEPPTASDNNASFLSNNVSSPSSHSPPQQRHGSPVTFDTSVNDSEPDYSNQQIHGSDETPPQHASILWPFTDASVLQRELGLYGKQRRASQSANTLISLFDAQLPTRYPRHYITTLAVWICGYSPTGQSQRMQWPDSRGRQRPATQSSTPEVPTVSNSLTQQQHNTQLNHPVPGSLPWHPHGFSNSFPGILPPDPSTSSSFPGGPPYPIPYNHLGMLDAMSPTSHSPLLLSDSSMFSNMQSPASLQTDHLQETEDGSGNKITRPKPRNLPLSRTGATSLLSQQSSVALTGQSPTTQVQNTVAESVSGFGTSVDRHAEKSPLPILSEFSQAADTEQPQGTLSLTISISFPQKRAELSMQVSGSAGGDRTFATTDAERITTLVWETKQSAKYAKLLQKPDIRTQISSCKNTNLVKIIWGEDVSSGTKAKVNVIHGVAQAIDNILRDIITAQQSLHSVGTCMRPDGGKDLHDSRWPGMQAIQIEHLPHKVLKYFKLPSAYELDTIVLLREKSRKEICSDLISNLWDKERTGKLVIEISPSLSKTAQFRHLKQFETAKEDQITSYVDGLNFSSGPGDRNSLLKKLGERIQVCIPQQETTMSITQQETAMSIVETGGNYFERHVNS